ncbi:hypoxanthine phosphoribosyltransferase [bacterium]|nr:hypoxanthine phosphoribosyltransferase [bacterium]MBT4249502.1 hypoxanthine phosphoribosyltransferase [bacterium]MBT5734400.1 hypoxanthine phosphoribosyltransferase [bacterium]MBT6017679.1 hypoxanthine phosphoribosyltransferase [bacterium]MBT6777948.1 hypoxanthine phosphoribosyltransferase [bacterium]
MSEISLRISENFHDTNPVIISILNGSFIFTADIIRELDIDCEVDFIKISSYEGMNSTGSIKMSKDLSIDIKNRRVIIVEDIIDSGLSIKYLYKHILNYKPRDITIVSLLAKTNNYKLNFNIDIIGFEISSEFVVGYGLDFNQRFRNLKSIFKLNSPSR